MDTSPELIDFEQSDGTIVVGYFYSLAQLEYIRIQRIYKESAEYVRSHYTKNTMEQ